MIDLAGTLDRIFGSPFARLAFVSLLLVAFGTAFRAGLQIKWSQNADHVESGKRYRRFSIIFAVILVASSFAVLACVRYGANQEIDTSLQSGVISVFVDDVLLQQPEAFIKALSHPCDPRFRRSHPETKHDVLIRTHAGILTLKIGQDSGVATDYWIFYPKFGLTQVNEVRRACNTGLLLE